MSEKTQAARIESEIWTEINRTIAAHPEAGADEIADRIAAGWTNECKSMHPIAHAAALQHCREMVLKALKIARPDEEHRISPMDPAAEASIEKMMLEIIADASKAGHPDAA